MLIALLVVAGLNGRPCRPAASRASRSALAVVVGPLAALLPGPELDPVLFALACAAHARALLVGALRVGPRHPSAQLWLSLGYLGILGLMREAGDGPAGFLPLVILPVVWLALYGTRRQLLIALGATALVLLVPWVLVGGARYPDSTAATRCWR